MEGVSFNTTLGGSYVDPLSLSEGVTQFTALEDDGVKTVQLPFSLTFFCEDYTVSYAWLYTGCARHLSVLLDVGLELCVHTTFNAQYTVLLCEMLTPSVV